MTGDGRGSGDIREYGDEKEGFGNTLLTGKSGFASCFLSIEAELMFLVRPFSIAKMYWSRATELCSIYWLR